MHVKILSIVSNLADYNSLEVSKYSFLDFKFFYFLRLFLKFYNINKKSKLFMIN